MICSREINWGDRKKYFKALDRVDYIVIHHTDSSDKSIVQIDAEHQNRKPPFYGVGYHYLIRANGDIERGRPENVMGAHCFNYNGRSLGIALTGNFMNTAPNNVQLVSAANIVRELLKKYPNAKVVRHKDLYATSCPGNLFPWQAFLSKLSSKPNSNSNSNVSVKVKGKTIKGTIINGHTYVWINDIAGAYGNKTKWDAKNRIVEVF